MPALMAAYIGSVTAFRQLDDQSPSTALADAPYPAVLALAGTRYSRGVSPPTSIFAFLHRVS